MIQKGKATPNAKQTYAVNKRDLPLYCPLPSMSLWNSHPRVFLPLKEAKTGQVKCPYCGTDYVLVEKST